MDVTFRESEPFYGEPTDLSVLFQGLDHSYSVQDGQDTREDSLDTNTDDHVHVQVQPIVGTIPVDTLTDGDVQVQVQPTLGTIRIGNLQLPVRNRWQNIPLVYSRRQPQEPQYSVVVDDADGSKESSADDGSPRFMNEAEIKLLHRKNHKDALMKRLHDVRRYYAYCKALLQLDFIKWNSNPEEVLKRIKESTRWSAELSDYKLQCGLEGHIKFLRMHVSKLDTTSTSSSMPEFAKVALEEDINSHMSSELENHLQFSDELLMQEYFNRVQVRNLARECCKQAEKTGVILVEEFLPIRHLEEEMLPRNFPQMKKRVKQSLESTRAYLHRQGATRARALKYVVCAISLACIITAGQRERPSMHKRDEHWSRIKHGDEGTREGDENDVSSVDFSTLKAS